jgi:hypothetical protein
MNQISESTMKPRNHRTRINATPMPVPISDAETHKLSAGGQSWDARSEIPAMIQAAKTPDQRSSAQVILRQRGSSCVMASGYDTKRVNCY